MGCFPPPISRDRGIFPHRGLPDLCAVKNKIILLAALCCAPVPSAHGQFAYERSLVGELEVACTIDFGDRMGLFAEAAVSPERNDNDLNIALGANLYGVLSRRRRDSAGVAIARGGPLRTPGRYETAVELSYTYNFTANISLEPEVQYIVPLPGTAPALPDALAGTVRLQLSF